MVAQVLAVVIFVAMFLLIVIDKIERHIVTLACFDHGACLWSGNAEHDGSVGDIKCPQYIYVRVLVYCRE